MAAEIAILALQIGIILFAARIFGKLAKKLRAPSVLGELVAGIVMLAVSSVLRHFLADSAIYRDSVVLKFFGESALLEALHFLDLGRAWFSELIG